MGLAAGDGGVCVHGGVEPAEPAAGRKAAGLHRLHRDGIGVAFARVSFQGGQESFTFGGEIPFEGAEALAAGEHGPAAFEAVGHDYHVAQAILQVNQQGDGFFALGEHAAEDLEGVIQIAVAKGAGEFVELAFANGGDHELDVGGGDGFAVACVNGQLFDFVFDEAAVVSGAVQQSHQNGARHLEAAVFHQLLHGGDEIFLDFFWFFRRVEGVDFA